MKIQNIRPGATLAVAALAGLALWGCNSTIAQTEETPVTAVKPDPMDAKAANTMATKTASPKQLFADMRVKWPKNRTMNIVWHGHSVVAGYHKTPEVKPLESYPFMVYQGLNERFPVAVLNNITTAIGGEASPKGAARFERDVLPYNPDLLFIDYAINDRSFPIEQVEKSWRSMIESAAKNGIPLVLITPTGTRVDKFTDPTNPLTIRAEMIRKLGKEYDLPVADVSRAWQAALDAGTPQESLLAQGLHPNGKGHEIAAAEILRTLDEMVAKAGKA